MIKKKIIHLILKMVIKYAIRNPEYAALVVAELVKHASTTTLVNLTLAMRKKIRGS